MINIMAENFSSAPLHPRDRLPKIPPTINLKPGRFWLLVEEFNGGVREISCDLERIKSFSFFTKNNYDSIRQCRLMHSDINIFTEMLSFFLEKEFIDPEKMFEKVCVKFQFEFLLL